MRQHRVFLSNNSDNNDTAGVTLK